MTTIAFPLPFKLDRSRHAAVQVFEHLRGMIIALALKPGTVLPRVELAEYFALSLTPIRDALMRLEEDGLVDIFPQHATVVRQIDVASAKQAHFLRLSMELEIVHTLASAAQPELVRALGESIARQQDAYGREDYDRFTTSDQDFHRQMYRAANVESLWDLMRNKSGDLDRLRRLHVPIPGKAESILDGHREIVAAIAKGDPALAQLCVRQHLSGTLAHLDDIRARYPEYLLDAGSIEN
ncbi:MAG: GntR family transcriptional regulator [Pseudomonadota bacterium]